MPMTNTTTGDDGNRWVWPMSRNNGLSMLAALRASLGPAARRAIETDIADTSMQLFKKAVFEDVPAAVPAGRHLLIVSSH